MNVGNKHEEQKNSKPVPQNLSENNTLKSVSNKYVLGLCLLPSITGDIYTASYVNDRNTSLYIKFLPESYFRSIEIRHAVRQEIDRIKKGCDIFNIIDFEQTDDSAYLVFELPRGNFLQEKMPKNKSYGDLSTVLSLVSNIKKSLDNIKKCGLVHGCVGLDSIYISNTNDVILVDSIYNSAKQHQLEQEVEHTVTLPNKEAIYASPDVCFGRPISEQDDVFSLACISYHLLSGEHPFAGENSVVALLSKVRPKRINSLTDAQWHHLENGMALAKENRLATIDDFINGFDKAIDSTKKYSQEIKAAKAKETTLARQQAERLLNTQKENIRSAAKKSQNKRRRNPRFSPRPLIPTKKQINRFSFDSFHLDLSEWAWIPLSLFSGILTGAILMGIAISFFGVSLF